MHSNPDCYGDVSGMGKTYLASHFSNQYINQKDENIDHPVFWHPFRKIGAYQNLLDQLEIFAHRYGLSTVISAFKTQPITTIELAKLVQTIPSNCILVFDRVEDAIENLSIRGFLKHLFRLDPRYFPFLIFIDQETLATRGLEPETLSVLQIQVGRFEEQDSKQLIKSIWNSCKRLHGKLQPLTSERIQTIYRMGRSGDPILTKLATNLAIQIPDDSDFDNIAETLRNESRAPGVELVYRLFSTLSERAKLFTLISACLIPPRRQIWVEEIYTSIQPEKDDIVKQISIIREEFKRSGFPFITYVGDGLDSICQLVSHVRNVIHKALERNLLNISPKLTYTGLHQQIGEYFQTQAIRECRDDRETGKRESEMAFHAFYHFKSAALFDRCLEIVTDHQKSFRASGKHETLREMIQQVRDRHSSLSHRRELDLTFSELNLLKTVAQHQTELDLVTVWIDKLGDQHPFDRARLLYNMATAHGGIGNYKRSADACADAIEVLTQLPHEETESNEAACFDLRGKISCRLIQSKMSIGNLEEALSEANNLLAFLESGIINHNKKTCTYHLAILFRHYSTIFSILGLQRGAVTLIEASLELNTKLKSRTGIAICNYKKARYHWLNRFSDYSRMRNVAGNCLSEADLAGTTLRWWKMAIIEQSAHIELSNRYTSSIHSNTSPSHTQKISRALQHYQRASEMLNVATDAEGVDSLPLRALEQQVILARIKGEQGNYEECFSIHSHPIGK